MQIPCATQQIRVAVIDDHPLYRTGVEEVLKRAGSYEIVCTVASLFEARQSFERVDVALLDWSLSDDPEYTLKTVLDHWPELRIVVMSAADDALTGHRALRSGALGFLPKSCGEVDLLSAVLSAACGVAYVPPVWGAEALKPWAH